MGIVDLEVEALAPGLEQVRAVQLAERGADDACALAGADDRDADEVGEVAGAATSRRSETAIPRSSASAGR